MLLEILAIAVLLGTGLAAALLPGGSRGLRVGMFGCIFACGLSFLGSLLALTSGHEVPAHAVWTLPLGPLQVGFDGLSAFFVLLISVVSGLAATFGLGYLRAYLGKRPLSGLLFSFNALVASMILVALARDAILFLMAWEVMAISSFFLVGFEHERPEVRRASLVYLVASQVGVIAVFVLFALLAKQSGGYGFESFLERGTEGPVFLAVLFVLALIGFGAKAGFWTLHVWLPEAHPAAPSPVSALMSGVMIKMGIYGFVRILTFLPHPPPWWGAALIIIGGVSGIAGVLQALGQHDLKRLLAYHSIENIGIIALGIGLGLLGQSAGNPTIAFLGYAGGLLHVLNHGLFKGLLFHGTGSLLHATGTKELNAMGGLFKKMPVTGTTFLIGSAAISGLPPLNGFLSEWLIYLGAFYGVFQFQGLSAGASVAVIPALGLIGGLASACFAKAFSVVFLGTPRSAVAREAQEVGTPMKIAMVAGSALCILIGLFPQWVLLLVESPVETILQGTVVLPPFLGESLAMISRTALFLLGTVGLLAYARFVLLRKRDVRFAPTWGCGYAEASARMQYTAGSFAKPLLKAFGPIVRRVPRGQLPEGYFPATARYQEHVVDRTSDEFWIPATAGVLSAFRRLKLLQQGKLQSYLLYILVTLIVLLLWKVR